MVNRASNKLSVSCMVRPVEAKGSLPSAMRAWDSFHAQCHLAHFVQWNFDNLVIGAMRI